MRVLVPSGTRPEIVKLAPVVGALREHGFDVRVVATGQHHDERLAGSFFRDLSLDPDETWVLPDDEGERVGRLLTLAFRELETHPADLVLVLGDTYTVPMFCLAAKRFGVPLVHVEAGLRSFNQRSMEETNRKIAACSASLHLAPTEMARDQLQAEGVPVERIAVIGNPVLDVLRGMGVRARPVQERKGILFTAHRSTNVDDPARLSAVVHLARELAEEIGPVTFPVHPRTEARLRQHGLRGQLDHPAVTVVPPLPYPDLLDTLTRARLVVTDSGGLQEEASWIGVPVIVLRHSTPRWEGVLAGTSVLVGLELSAALSAAHRLASEREQARIAAMPCPYGDGHAAERVPAVLRRAKGAGLLELREPENAPAYVR